MRGLAASVIIIIVPYATHSITVTLQPTAVLNTDTQLNHPPLTPGRAEWFYKIHESRRIKKRQNAQDQNLEGKNAGIAGNAKSLNLNYCEAARIHYCREAVCGAGWRLAR